MADVVIFGVKDTASLAHFYLRHDSPHNIVGFTVHREYLPAEKEFEGLPVVPFEDLEARFPPDRISAFAPMTHRRMNRAREAIYNALKARGYSLISYISSRAAHFPNSQIGDNCFVLEDSTIQPFVTIGNNVMIWSGSHIGHHSVVADHVFLAPCVAISGHCEIGARSFLGLNSTIRDQVALGEGTLVGMGAIISKNSAPGSVYRAEPTRLSNRSSSEIDL